MKWIIGNITYWAVSWVRWQLRRDKRPGSWYWSYQASIGMIIFDECRNRSWVPKSLTRDQLHDFSNTCARTFMDQWVDKLKPAQAYVDKLQDPDR
jgi:hypothetical protein